MKYDSFDALVETALEHSDEEERNKINKEVKLFQKREWEPYILFLANVMNLLKREYIGQFKSACDSYLLKKACQLEGTDRYLLNNAKAESILNNDALRMELIIPFTEINTLRKVSDAIEDTAAEMHMYYREILIDNNKELIILSHREPNPDDYDVILKERRNSTEEENEILRKYLLLEVCMGL